MLRKLAKFYDTNYKKLLIIPTIILFLALFLIAYKVSTTGDFINRGVSLKGGITITIPTVEGTSAVELQEFLESSFPSNDISVRILKQTGRTNGLIADVDITDSDEAVSFQKAIEGRLEITSADYSEETMGSSLGNSFFRETIKAIIIAFFFMSAVVFFYFRIPTPSLAVILAALSDIISTLAVVNILGIKLSTAGIAAFLMLIGYSVDTDILLSTHVLKTREGTVPERIRKAMKTGFMMSATTIGAVVVGLLFAQSDVLRQIMIILLIGLGFDLIYTWLQNATLLRMYMEKKNG